MFKIFKRKDNINTIAALSIRGREEEFTSKLGDVICKAIVHCPELISVKEGGLSYWTLRIGNFKVVDYEDISLFREGHVGYEGGKMISSKDSIDSRYHIDNLLERVRVTYNVHLNRLKGAWKELDEISKELGE